MSTFDRLINRLHSVFNKDPQAAPLADLFNTGPIDATVTISATKIEVQRGNTYDVLPLTADTTIADMVAFLAGVGIRTTDTTASASLPIIGMREETFILSNDGDGIFLQAEDGTVFMTEEGESMLVEEYNA